MLDRSSWPFFGALLSLGVLAVHQLRYLIAYGADAGEALGASGHGYLTIVEPVAGLLVAFAVAAVLRRIARGGRGERSPHRGVLVVMFGIALLTAYAGQELIEGELAAGHAAGLAGIFGGGGWVAVPLAAAIGALLALAVKVVAAVSRAAVPPRAARAAHAPVIFDLWTSCADAPPRQRRDRRRSGRSPPVLSTT